MNIRYPIYEGVYRILTNKGRKEKRDKRETEKKAQRKGSKKKPDSRQHSACTEK